MKPRHYWAIRLGEGFAGIFHFTMVEPPLYQDFRTALFATRKLATEAKRRVGDSSLAPVVKVRVTVETVVGAGGTR